MTTTAATTVATLVPVPTPLPELPALPAYIVLSVFGGGWVCEFCNTWAQVEREVRYGKEYGRSDHRVFATRDWQKDMKESVAALPGGDGKENHS